MGSRRRTNFLVRLAVLSVIVFFVVSIVQMQVKLTDLKQQKTQAESKLNAIKDNIDEINERLATPVTDEYIRKIVREKFGYYDVDEIIFYNDLGS